ncbi:MAG: insulinase family protein [Bacteroidetes bacterium]|nr:insulinase family protein [Bacteroidota bacterium]
MKKIVMKGFLTLAVIAFMLTAMAQEKNYDWNSAVTLDPNVKMGKLDNGLTYYIRHNSHPKDRAEFYLAVNAGAILEDDDQNGLAHFCEHMAFNGTKNFEKHDIINYLQSIGMKFGPEINAFTSQDVTTYMLQKVPVTPVENIDTALLILHDWASNVSFEDEEIDNERGVIHEEWRTRRGAMFRMMTKTDKTLYQGSKYADRDVIGDIEIIDNAPYEVLKRFYNDWYRPDLQAIIAVGDFDADWMEGKIKDLFSAIPAATNPKERVDYPVPDHSETLVAIETDPEAQYTFVQLHYKHPAITNKDLGYYRQTIVHQLYNTMLNNRLQELLQEENPPFIYGYTAYSSMVRTKDSYMSFAVAKNDGIKRTLETLLVENERVKKYGFTETELERAKKEILSQIEKQYKEKEKQESQSYVWQYYGHFLENEPSPGVEFDYAFIQDILPGITLEELNKLAPKWITDDNRVVIITGPEREDVIIPMKDEVIAIVESIDQAEIEPYVDKVSDKPLMAEKPVPGKVEKVKKDKKLGTEKWILSNGIEVILKPTDFKDDEILMQAFSFGGSSLYDLDDQMSAGFCSSMINESGIAGFDLIELQKLLAGKIVNVSPYVGDMDEGFSGSCSVKELETMLQLVNLYYTQPPRNEKAFNSYVTRIKGFLENRKNDPGAAFQDTISVTMANYHPMVRPLTPELMDEIDFNRLNFIFRERFGDPTSFTFYFVGNIDTDSLRPLVETYLASLPKVTRQENWRDNGIRPPQNRVEKKVIKEMEVPKGTVYIAYTGEYDFNNFRDRMDLSVLCDILDVRYTESIREEQSGTYGVGIYDLQNQYPYERYQVNITFDCDPDQTDKLKSIVYEEIDKLKTDGPQMKDLNGVKENLLKTRQEKLKENRFWLSTLKNFDYNAEDAANFLDYEDYVNDMTQESLKAAANKFFGDNQVEIILLPSNTSDNVKNPSMQ